MTLTTWHTSQRTQSALHQLKRGASKEKNSCHTGQQPAQDLYVGPLSPPHQRIIPGKFGMLLQIHQALVDRVDEHLEGYFNFGIVI